MDAIQIGLILKAKREEMDLSQRAIADTLGYSNANFITMVEKGRSPIPVKKLFSFVRVYGLDVDFAVAALLVSQPEVLESMHELFAKNPDLAELSFPALEKRVSATFNKMVKKYLPTMKAAS